MNGLPATPPDLLPRPPAAGPMERNFNALNGSAGLASCEGRSWTATVSRTKTNRAFRMLQFPWGHGESDVKVMGEMVMHARGENINVFQRTEIKSCRGFRVLLE